MIFALALLASPPCESTDYACKAEHFERLAEQTKDRVQRLRRLYLAHVNALAQFQKSGERSSLCKSRELLEKGLALEPPPPDMVEPLRQASEALGRYASKSCAEPRKERPARAPALAHRGASSGASTTSSARASINPASVQGRIRLELLDADDPVAAVGTREAPQGRSAEREPVRSGVDLADTGAPRRHRLHTAAGGVLAGFGLGSLGLFSVGVGVLVDTASSIRAIAGHARAEERPLTVAEDTRIQQLYTDALVIRDATIAAGVVGVVTVAGGIALLATRKGRHRKVQVAPHGGAFGGGLTLLGRF